MRIGLIGCGAWGKFLLRDLLALECHVTVLCRSEESRARAREGNAHKIISTIDEFNNMDGFVVATLTSTHAEVIESLLPFKRPIYVEKPLCSDAKRARQFLNSTFHKIFVMDKWRYCPGIEALTDIAKNSELGTVLGLQTQRLSWGCPHPDVNPIWTLAPHDLSIALHMLGHFPAPKAATGLYWRNKPAGIKAILGSDPWFSMEVSSTHPIYKREIRLDCEKGFAVLESGDENHIKIYHQQDRNNQTPIKVEKRNISTEYPTLRELRAFVGYLKGGPAPHTRLEDAVTAVELIEKLHDMAGLPKREPNPAEVAVPC